MIGRTVTLVNARVVTPDGEAASIRFGRRIMAIDAPPSRGDVVVDAGGSFVLPGLINAHDHLELNHYGPLKGRNRYDNASAWIADLTPRLAADASIRANLAFPLASRLFVGGLKNLLAGVTTVAHHNPRYAEIGVRFPVRVVRRYGWAHSFHLEGRAAGARGEPAGLVAARYRETPRDAPFIVHLAEGVDGAAAAELDRLDALGCLADNTVLVHGIALDPDGWRRVVSRSASLVWCPASNAFLFGRTLNARVFLDERGAEGRLCLGTDSRLTGSPDLLHEMRAAAALGDATPAELLRMVTTAAAGILRLPDAGRLAPGARADLVVVEPTHPKAADALLSASRRDLALVAVGGRPLAGTARFAKVFRARARGSRPIVVDGAERLADGRLARAIARCPIREPGVVAG
ncbi:MAG: amidohydrolase family protein [Betaproteobacteria bacterium]